MPDTAMQADFHLGAGWYDPWRAAYLPASETPHAIASLPLLDGHAWLGPVRYRHRRSQTNVHSPRLDLPGGTAPDDLPARLLADGMHKVTLDYVAANSRLYVAAAAWRGRVSILPQAQAPVVDCRAPYAAWLAGRSKRGRARWPKIERALTRMGMTFELHGGSAGLDAMLDACFRVEQSGWKGQEGTSIRDSAADTLFYTRLAHEAAADGALRLAILRYEGQVVAFEYGVVGGDRLFLLKVGYDERFEHLSIGHGLAVMNIRHCCGDPAIAWYDKLGNGMTPAAYKLRFADTIDLLHRITLFAPGWRGGLLYAHERVRQHAKLLRDRWRGRGRVPA